MKRIPKTQHGVTLVELLIVVVIVGILAALAYPSYMNYMIRGHRTAAQAFMMDIASKQEQYRLDARTYTDTLTDLGLSVPNEVTPFYTIAITPSPPSATQYTITATPKVGSVQVGDGSLTLNNLGTKTPADKWD
jgi:type IV pilus assembly protein PilE